MILLACTCVASFALSITSLLFSIGIIKFNDKEAINEIKKEIQELKLSNEDKYKDYRNENGLLSNKNKLYKNNR